MVLGEAAFGPLVGALHRTFLVGTGVDERGEFVERKDDVGAQLVLDADRDLGCEAVQRTVEMRPERHAVVVDVRQAFLALGDDVVGLYPVGVHGQHLLEPDAQGQHLEAAAVGEGGPRPVHERTQAAGLGHDVRARLQVEVIRVGQDGLGAKLFHGLRQHRFDGGGGSDRDERRGVDVAVGRMDGSDPAESALQLGRHGEVRLIHREPFNRIPTRFP